MLGHGWFSHRILDYVQGSRQQLDCDMQLCSSIILVIWVRTISNHS